MKHLPLISSFCSTPRRKLYMAIAAHMIVSAGAQAAPIGGTIVGGDGSIEQSGVDTTVIQNTDHLAIDWESFDLAVEERVQFIQPDSDSVALNRILGNEASQIFGRLDANGHVILMNPNGVLFGESASVNVGGLVASGLNINADDFMNGDFVLQAVEGTDGAVINKGIINAATGGNIALIGKQVDNQGLISAKLGAVTLAAGKEAVLTFDNQGLLGVRVSKEILQDELGIGAAVSNSGDINAEGGQILMTGSVSQDIFSQAVNAEGLNAKTSVVMHEDGSFTLGAGADVVNTGTISTSSDTTDAGQIVVLGENVDSSGAILANSKTANAAGNIEIHSRDTTLLTEQSQTSATNDVAGSGGQIKILGDRVGVLDQSQIDASGTNGGGDINIGGGFQGKETQLRNATRTVVGKETLIEANAITDGDGGDIIVWADETTSFTGEINVRGGELGGDGGFVEVSGKKNLRFLGNVDRSAVRGENGTLLLDPEIITIVKESEQPPANGDEELLDTEVLFADRQDVGELRISDAAISTALSLGNVVLQASREIGTYNPGDERAEIISNSSNSLIMESGGTIILSTLNFMLGSGSLILSSGLLECGGIPCWVEVANPQIADRINLSELDLVTTGDLIVRSRGIVDLFGIDISVTSLDLASYKGVTINTVYDDASIDAAGTMDILAGSVFSSETVVLPSGQIYTTPVQTAPYQGEVIVGSVRLNGDINVSGETNIRSSQGIAAELSSRLNLVGNVFFDADGSIRFLRNGDISTSILNPGGDVYLRSGGNIEFYASTDYAISESGLNRFILPANSTSSFTFESGGNIQLGELEIGDGNILIDATAGIDLGQISGGDINLIAQQDIVLPTIVSAGDLNVESALGSISFFGELSVVGDTTLSAAEDIVFLGAEAGNSDVPASVISENGDVRLSARNVNMGSWDENHTPLDIGGNFIVNFEEFARIKGIVNAGEGVEISTQTGMLSLGWGSINTRGSFYADLAEGSYDGGLETGGFMSINAGQIDIIGSELLLADVELNGDSALGTGDINITMIGDGDFAYPSINRQQQVTTGDLTIDLQSSGATTRFYGDESSAIYVDGAATISAIGNLIIPDFDVEGDLSITSVQGGIALTGSIFEDPRLPSLVSSEGNVTFSAGADIFIPDGSSLNVVGTTTLDAAIDVIFDEAAVFSPEGDVSILAGRDISLRSLELNGSALFEVGGDLYLPEISTTNAPGGRGINLNVQGTIYQRYDVYTGGADFTATASEFVFDYGVEVNTDYSNPTLDALSGNGNVSIQSTSDQAELVLPGITTQTDCVNTSACGTLSVAGASVSNKGSIHVFGNTDFTAQGGVQLRNSFSPDSGNSISIENSFLGVLAVDAAYAEISSSAALILGEWRLTSNSDASIIAMPGYDGDFSIVGHQRLDIAGSIFIGGSFVELTNPETRIGRLTLSTRRANIEYSTDLELESVYLFGDESGAASNFKVGGDIRIMESGYVAGGFLSTSPILEVEAAAPIIFDVAGNIQLLGERNRLSSIQILNAQNVEIFNNGELTLDGVNAESLSLNVLGNVVQSDALTVSGDTSIIAAPGTNIDLSNPLNDFNTLSLLATGSSVINIADSGSISLADIDLNGAGQGGALSVTAANITQVDSGRIFLHDSAQLNLQADYITLGANGTASVDINGAVLNGVFTNDLNIQGTIRGAAGVADTRLAGLYFNGSTADNFVELATGASISGDFRDGSKISMGDGSDIASLAGELTVAIEGGAGEDTFIIASPGVNIAQILGGDDRDVLAGPDADNNWTLMEGGIGTIASSVSAQFNGIERIEGGNAADNFVVDSTGLAIELIGGDGVDSLTGNSTNSLVNNQWAIDGVNSGSLNELVLFSSVENLIGNDGADSVTFLESAQIGDVSTGLGNDTFTLAADVATGLLDAGGGQDTLNLNGLNSIYTYFNELIGGDGSYTTAGFEIENNEGGSKTIVGVDGYDAEWTIDGDGSVSVNALQGSTTETNRFTGVTRVEGASGNDTFILQGGYLAGGIVGGQGGSDTLIADTGLGNNWLIDGQNSGKVQVVEAGREQVFEAIINLVGGSDNDIFNILSGADIDGTMNGGEGTNSLIVLDPVATSVWTIASTNDLRVETPAGVVSQIVFNDIQSLIGNSNEDVLDLSAIGGSVDLNLGSAAEFVFQNFDNFVSDGGNFLGTDANTSWILNGVSEISFQDKNGIDQRYSFSGFRGIHGGSGEDYFQIDGRWFATGGQIFAESLSESPDTAELNIDVSSAWNFNSGDSTEVYLGVASTDSLFTRTRSDALNTLADTGNPLVLLGIEKNIGGKGDDIFLVYGDSGLYDPYIDGSEGNDYLAAYNWGAAQDLIWNVTEDYGGDINAAVQFRNFENLRSFDFFEAETRGVVSRFNISAGVEIGSLVGDSTNTIFNVGAQASIAAITDNGGTDTINVSDGTNAWQLDETGGSLNTTTFSGVEILNGGASPDNFILTSATTEVTQIEGGSGENSLMAFNQDNTWNLGASTSTLNNDLQFNNITNLIGSAGVDTFVSAESGLALNIDGGDGVDELRGSDQLNTWSVDGTYAGTLNDSLTFTSVEHLQGGALADDFTATAGSSVGQIAGGGGDDTISLGTGASAIYILGEAGSDRVVLGDFVTITGNLDGGVGDTDTLDISAFSGAFEFDFLTETTDTGLTYTNFEQEILPDTGTSFFGGDGVTRWTFAEDNSFLIEKLDEDGNVVKSGTFSSYKTVRGGAGENAFVLSPDANFAGAIRGDAAGNNTLTAADLVNGWIIDGQNQGRLQAEGGAAITLFSNIAHLIGGAAADNFDVVAGGSVAGSIHGSAGMDTLMVSDPAAINNWQLGSLNSVGVVGSFQQIETLVGNANEDTFTFANATDVVSIQGEAGNDMVLWMAGAVAVNLASEQINDAVAFAGIDGFNAESAGDHLLIGADQQNTWTLTGADSGTVNSINFLGFGALQGGSGSDLFNVAAAGSVSQFIDGAAGTDTVTAADQINQWLLSGEGGELNDTRFINFEVLNGGASQDDFVLTDATSQAQTVDGGAGANRLIGYDQANLWNLTSDNAGTVTGLANFGNIQTLIGGSQVDTFTLAAGIRLSEIYAGAGNDLFIIGAGVAADNFYGEAGDDSVEVEVGLELSGVLDGGSGGETDGDYINLSKYTLLDATAELESVLGFAFLNFERIDEPNTQGVYFGGDGTNFWYITGANEGRLEIRDGEDAGVYEFSGVHSLLGGEGEDIFIFANDAAVVSTLIDGGEGAGANTLDLSAQGLINEWLLSGVNSGLVSNASNTSGNIFTNIAYLIGGSNQDVFDLQTGGSIAGAIDGGLGGDELRVSVEQTSNWQLGGVVGHSVTGIAGFTNIEALTGSAGTDNFDILAELTDVTQLNGGAGSDAVNFLYGAPVTVDLADGLAAGLRVESVERFTTADARSVFTGVESAATWTVDGADQGSIQYLRPADGNLINVAFDGFGNLIGGAGGDQFVVAQGGSLSGTLSGGGGRNTVDLQEVVGEIHIATSPDAVIADGLARMTLADVDQLIGNGRTWLYGASDRSYTWTIDGIRSGQVTSTLVDDSNRLLAFENLSAIRGGTHDDIFQVIAESPLLSLDGGSAVTADLVDYSRVNGNLRISLADALTGQNGELTGVEGIRGNNSGPDSLYSAELAGPDSGAVWSIGSLAGDGLADGVNDGRVAFDDQTITFVDFNVLTGGAGVDTFNQAAGIVLGTLNGGAGDDVFNVDVTGANAGTRVVGGAGNDSLLLRGGDAAGVMTYTAAENGGEFDYVLAEVHYKTSHREVESVRDRTVAATLDIRGSGVAETFSLANDRFWVNDGSPIEYSNKPNIAVRSGIDDFIEIADNLVIENSLTLANGTVIANDPANNSISVTDLILDSTRDVGLSSARLRTSVDNLFVRNSAGDIYLQEQNGLNLAEFNANGIFDLLLLNGDLTNSAPLMAADVFRTVASNGDITLTGANQLRDDVAVTGGRVELHNASTLTLIEVNAEDLYLRTQRGVEGDGPITVAGVTDIDAQGDVLLDFATNDFNRVRVTNAVNLTLVDQNAIELLDINATGTVVVRSTNTVTLNDNVTGANGVDVSSGAGSINQNGTISTNSGSVVVSAGNGEVNLGEDAKIVSNGGSVNINAGAGNVNMGGDTRIAANGGDVNIVAADSVVVAEVVSSGNVNINAGSGSVSDGNGGATNVAAGGLQSSSNTGFGDDDALETDVGNIDISTNSGNVAVSNSGNITVDNVSTGQGDISLVNVGDVELGGGSVIAEDGANGGSVNIDVSQGSVSQNGPTDVPAVKGGGVVVINAPDGAVGEGGGLRVDAPFVEIIAAIKAGDIFVNPGADKIEYFSGSFKFDDQLLAVEPLEDINPAIFANVKSYFFNDISLLLPRDQLYDEDEEE